MEQKQRLIIIYLETVSNHQLRGKGANLVFILLLKYFSYTGSFESIQRII